MSAFDNARMVPRIGLSEEQAQLLEVAESFCRDKSPVDKVRALIEEDGLRRRFMERHCRTWAGWYWCARKLWRHRAGRGRACAFG